MNRGRDGGGILPHVCSTSDKVEDFRVNVSNIANMVHTGLGPAAFRSEDGRREGANDGRRAKKGEKMEREGRRKLKEKGGGRRRRERDPERLESASTMFLQVSSKGVRVEPRGEGLTGGAETLKSLLFSPLCDTSLYMFRMSSISNLSEAVRIALIASFYSSSSRS